MKNKFLLPLRHRTGLFLSLTCMACIASSMHASAQLYVETSNLGQTAEYDPNTGALINPNFINLNRPAPVCIAIDGNNLFEGPTTSGTSPVGSVGEWDANTGASINPSFITGLPGVIATKSIAIFDNNLFLANNGTISVYNATTGVPISANLISGIGKAAAIAISGNNLFVYSGSSIAEYNAKTGAAINPNFVTGLTPGTIFGNALAISGNGLYVALSYQAGGSVAEYNATTGAPINTSLVTGLSQQLAGIAVSGDYLYADHLDTVGKYDANTGSTIDASFITGLPIYTYGIAVAPEPNSFRLLAVSLAAMCFLGRWVFPTAKQTTSS